MPSTRLAETRHGIFTYHSEDKFLGASLRIYGEYSEGEVDVYKALLRPTDVAVEVGANIGALTVPLARCCSRVFTFEPQPDNYKLLQLNLKFNNIANVTTYPYAIGAKAIKTKMPSIEESDINYGRIEVGEGSCDVDQRTLDEVLTDIAVTFIKMDCEGMELDVFQGGENLIKTNQPVIYVENDRPAKSAALIAWLRAQNYEMFWHCPPLYREDNFRKYNDNIFGVCDSKNMLCYPKGYKGPVLDWITEPVV